jgi:hypothetical protein
MTHQLSKHADVGGATKAAGAEHKPDTNRFRHTIHD